MRLSRLRASVTTEQLLMFGWNSTLDQLPPAHDTENFFPQCVPTRQKVPTPAFTVTWIWKVNSVRAVPSRIQANPPPLSTGLLWGTREQQLADPYQVAATLFRSDAFPSYRDPMWLRPCSALGKKCSLCPETEANRLLPRVQLWYQNISGEVQPGKALILQISSLSKWASYNPPCFCSRGCSQNMVHTGPYHLCPLPGTKDRIPVGFHFCHPSNIVP